MSGDEVTLDEVRALILRAAPDPEAARGVLDCPPDEPLDARIPFSSLIVLGAVVALEDRYGVRVTRKALGGALREGVTLRRLQALVEELRATAPGEARA